MTMLPECRPNTDQQRIIELDGLRGLAVIFVLIHHYYTGVLPAALPPVLGFFRDLTAPFCLSGVDLFFVISGFIVGGIVIDGVGEHGFFKRFYIRRATRILPLYFSMYGLFLVATRVNQIHPNPMGLWLVKNNMPLWSYAIFMQNYYMALAGQAGGKFFAMAWSVATEEHFYLLFPVLLLWLGLRRVAMVCLALLLVCPIIRCLALEHLTFFAAYAPFPSRADSISYGVLVAVAVRRWPGAMRTKSAQIMLSAFCVLVGILLALNSLRIIVLGDAAVFSFLAAFYALVISIGVVNRGAIAPLLRSKILIFFGFISYALYMFHQTVNGLMHGFIFQHEPQMQSVAHFTVTSLSVAIAVGLAYLSSKYFEAPIRAAGYRMTRTKTSSEGTLPLPASSHQETMLS